MTSNGTGIIRKDDQHQVVRVHNFLLSYRFHDDNNNNNKSSLSKCREPTSMEYKKLQQSTDEFLVQYFQKVCMKYSKLENVPIQIQKITSTITKQSYCMEQIPNSHYTVCIRYTYTDMYYSIDSILTDEMEVMAEGLFARALGSTKYIETLQSSTDTGPFQGTESVYFQYFG